MSYKAKVATFLKLVVLGALLPVSASAQDVTSERPAVIKAVAPLYPRAFKGTLGEVDIGGEVSVEVRVDESGEVRSADVLTGRVPFRSFAITAAEQWRFARAQDGGGWRTVKLVFSFRTMPRSAPYSEMGAIYSFADVYQVEVRRWSVEKQKPLRRSQPPRS